MGTVVLVFLIVAAPAQIQSSPERSQPQPEPQQTSGSAVPSQKSPQISSHEPPTLAESDPWRDAKPYLDDPLPKLQKLLPELKSLNPASNQEQLNYILDRTGEKCVELLRRTPNLSSHEEVISVVPTPAWPGFSLRQHVGIQRQTFEYLLIPHRTPNDDIEVGEYRTVNGRPAEASDLTFGPAFSVGFVSEWLHLYPGNRSESRFRYLGEQFVDKHKTFVLAFAQIPSLVKFPANFQAEGTSVPILFQGIVWIDSSDFRIIRMREDLLAPRPDIHLREFTTRIRFDEVHIVKAGLYLWLPEEVDIDWYFEGVTVHRSHRYSKYRLFAATPRIVPPAP